MSSTHPVGDVTAGGAMAIYPFNKNLLLKANYERAKFEKLATDKADTFRVYLSYKILKK